MTDSFEKYKNEIVNCKPLNQTLKYDCLKWLNALDSFENDINEIHSEFKGAISREHLIEFATKVKDANDKSHSVKLFLACMMWGYGGNSEKSIDHRGTYRVNEILKSDTNVKKNIHEAFLLIVDMDIEKAFNLLSKIKGLSISFLSKFLYFASKGCGHTEYALIFDARVANSLIRLTSTNPDLVSIVNISPSTSYKHYDAYIKLVHQIASDFKCEAENIEYYLFEQGGKEKIEMNDTHKIQNK